MKFTILLFAGCCIVAGHVQAALFSDDEAHNQLRLLRERVVDLEIARKQQDSILKKQEAELKQLEAARKQQIDFTRELQSQLEAQRPELIRLNGQYEVIVRFMQDEGKKQAANNANHEKELRSLRNQHEELKRALQDAEKRQIESGHKQENSLQAFQTQLNSKLDEEIVHQQEIIKEQGNLLHKLQAQLDKQQAEVTKQQTRLDERMAQQEKRILQILETSEQNAELSKVLFTQVLGQQEGLNIDLSQLKESGEKQTQNTLALQGQLDSQGVEFKKLQGYSEDLENKLKGASQRLENIYTDLDARILHFDAELKKQGQILAGELHKLQGKSEELVANKVLDMENKVLAMDKRNADFIQQQNNSLMNWQAGIEAQNKDLRSQNEALLHNLQEIEKQQKNLHGDMNNRLHQLDSVAVVDLKKQVGMQIGETTMLRGQQDELGHNLKEVEKRQAEVGRQQSTLLQKLQTQEDLLNTELRKLRSQNEELVRNLHESKQRQAEVGNQQTASFDLQAKIDKEQNEELRKLRSQNDNLLRSLQDAEKRQKEFYSDMDATLRQFESIIAGAPSGKVPASSAAQPVKKSSGAAADESAMDIRAYDLAYGQIKAGNYQHAINDFQEFLKKYPDSAHAANAHYQMGNAYFNLKDYKNALDSYQLLVNKYSSNPNVPEAMLGIADCQHHLKAVNGAKKTLNQIIAKYPESKAADQAKKRLDNIK